MQSEFLILQAYLTRHNTWHEIKRVGDIAVGFNAQNCITLELFW